jgi:hypothetical protein
MASAGPTIHRYVRSCGIPARRKWLSSTTRLSEWLGTPDRKKNPSPNRIGVRESHPVDTPSKQEPIAVVTKRYAHAQRGDCPSKMQKEVYQCAPTQSPPLPPLFLLYPFRRPLNLSNLDREAFAYTPPWAASGRCQELRRACEHKAELGEEGEGNCRRYRETCQQGQSRRQLCHELRYACLHKEELGEEGQGNCQRYRETCR